MLIVCHLVGHFIPHCLWLLEWSSKRADSQAVEVDYNRPLKGESLLCFHNYRPEVAGLVVGAAGFDLRPGVPETSALR